MTRDDLTPRNGLIDGLTRYLIFSHIEIKTETVYLGFALLLNVRASFLGSMT
jgi:hypothetical protein